MYLNTFWSLSPYKLHILDLDGDADLDAQKSALLRQKPFRRRKHTDTTSSSRM